MCGWGRRFAAPSLRAYSLLWRRVSLFWGRRSTDPSHTVSQVDFGQVLLHRFTARTIASHIVGPDSAVNGNWLQYFGD